MLCIKSFNLDFNKDNTIKTLLILAASFFCFNANADFHFKENGPVSASLYYYQFSNSALHIDYKGYLQECDEYYLGNDVNLILILRDRFENKVTIKKKMISLCKNPIDPSSITKTTYTISPKKDYKLWAAVFKNGEFSTIEVAFEFENKWDSNFSKNYLISFK